MRTIAIALLGTGCVGRIDGGGAPREIETAAREVPAREPVPADAFRETDCGDGLDDDGDGYADCLDDFDCEGFACGPGRTCWYGLCAGGGPEREPEPEPAGDAACPAGSDGWPCDEWGVEIDCGGGRVVKTHDWYVCRAAECVLNDGAFDAWGLPSCGHAGNVCGRDVSCAGAGAVCEGIRDWATWDCATCCFTD